jgi:hypothetical protein
VHPKKLKPKNCYANLKIGKVPVNSVFWPELFLGELFTKCTLLKSVLKDGGIFYTQYNLFIEKSFHLKEESMCTFYELKSPKCKQPLNIS